MHSRLYKESWGFLFLTLLLVFGISNNEGAEKPQIKRLTLSELKEKVREAQGKVILIDFWATTSPASRHSMPFLNKLYESYGDNGLVVIGVAIEGVGEEVIRPFVEMLGVKYPVFIGGDDLVEAYDIQYIPVTYLLDRSGKIGLKELGFTKETSERIRRKVEELIKADK